MISMVTNFVYPLQELQSWEFTVLMSANTNGGGTKGSSVVLLPNSFSPDIFLYLKAT